MVKSCNSPFFNKFLILSPLSDMLHIYCMLNQHESTVNLWLIVILNVKFTHGENNIENSCSDYYLCDVF